MNGTGLRGTKMKLKLLLICLLIIPNIILAQIYYTGFETGFDGFKPNGSAGAYKAIRVGVLYGIHPVGSWMIDVNQAYLFNVNKLNMKAGRTYNFSFKYNNSYSGGYDTTFIARDTLQTNSIVLGGTTKIGLPTNKPGTSDQNWHIVNFSVTPTENGGYWHVNNWRNYSEIQIDSMTVIGDTSNYVFNFKTPTNLTRYLNGDTVKFSWHATNYDSTSILLPTGIHKVYHDSTYNYIAPDTTLQFTFTAYSYQYPPLTDSRTLLFKGGHKYLYIDTVKNYGRYIRTISKGVDSLKYYADGVLFARSHVNATQNPNVTVLLNDLTGQNSSAVIIVQEDRNIDSTLTMLKTYNVVGQYASGSQCMNYLVTNPFQSAFVFDPGCGWVSGMCGYPGIIKAMWISGNVHYTSSRASEAIMNQPACACEGLEGAPMMIDSKLVCEGADLHYMNPSTHLFAETYCPIATNGITYDFWHYWVKKTAVSGGKFVYHLMADDLLNNIAGIDYLDFTAATSGWTQLFLTDSYTFGAYSYPYEVIYRQAQLLHNNSATALYRSGCGDQAIVPIPVISSAEIKAMQMPLDFVPQLIMQDAGGYYGAISVPLLKPRDLSPLLYDTWITKVKVKNFFRGIYPKAIKYLRWPQGK
jgi:hypothetical protein